MKKQVITHENIWQFQNKENLSSKDIRLLMEALRRRHFLKSNKWVGLGSPSFYKSRFFIADGEETKRVSNWYVLTKAGEEMLNKIEKFFLIPKNVNSSHPLNHFLFTL